MILKRVNDMIYIFFMISALFVPPNPKEFDRNAFIFFEMVLSTMLRCFEYSSGVSKLMFGAIKSCCIISIAYMISLAPAIQHSCPVMELVELTSGLQDPNNE